MKELAALKHDKYLKFQIPEILELWNDEIELLKEEIKKNNIFK